MAAEILPAIIPAGSLIYIGTNNDVVSNKLIVFGSLGEAAKYLGIKKFDAPIDTRRLPYKEIIHEIGQKVRV